MDIGVSVCVYEWVCECVRVFREGAGVCGLSVYLSGGTPHRPQHFQA